MKKAYHIKEFIKGSPFECEICPICKQELFLEKNRAYCKNTITRDNVQYENGERDLIGSFSYPEYSVLKGYTQILVTNKYSIYAFSSNGGLKAIYIYNIQGVHILRLDCEPIDRNFNFWKLKHKIDAVINFI